MDKHATRHPSLAVFFFHPTIERGGVDYIKPHHGKFFDEISPGFSRVDLVAPYFPEAQIPEWMKKGGNYYDYRPRSEKIRLVRGWSSRLAYPFRTAQYFRHALGADYSLFFTPSIASIVLGPILRLLGKPYYCYVAVEVSKYYKDRLGNGLRARALAWLQKRAINGSQGVLATGSRNLKAFPKCPQVLRVSPLLDVSLRFDPTLLDSRDRSPTRWVFVGVIHARKRIHIAIEAVGAMKKRGISVELDILGAISGGQEEYAESLRVLARDLGVEDQIRFQGYVRDPETLAGFIRGAGFLLLLSEYEGFPKVVYEAMGFGAIPVLTRLDSYEGFLEEGENAVFVEGRSGDEVAQRILEVTEKDGVRIRRTNLEFVMGFTRTPASAQFLGFFSGPQA